MPISYVNDKALGLSVTVIEGLLMVDDWRAHALRQIADPEWPAGPMSLTDARRAKPFGLEVQTAIDEMASLYSAKQAQMRNMRLAIIANETFASARAFENAVEPHGTRSIVFNDLATACVWLGVNRSDVNGLIDKARDAMQPPRSE